MLIWLYDSNDILGTAQLKHMVGSYQLCSKLRRLYHSYLSDFYGVAQLLQGHCFGKLDRMEWLGGILGRLH